MPELREELLEIEDLNFGMIDKESKIVVVTNESTDRHQKEE
jgi:hypothetical protein